MPTTGLEPARHMTLVPKTSASAIPPHRHVFHYIYYNGIFNYFLAAAGGVEPPHTESKSVVLPIDYAAVLLIKF